MVSAKWTSKTIEPPFIESISVYYPAYLCKKGNKQPTGKVAKNAKKPLGRHEGKNQRNIEKTE